VVEHIQQGDRAERPVNERERRRVCQVMRLGRPHKHLGRRVNANPAALGQVRGQLPLDAADIQDRRQALDHLAPRDAFVDVGSERVPSKHRARQPKALGILVVVRLDRGARRLIHPASCCEQRLPGRATHRPRLQPKRARQRLHATLLAWTSTKRAGPVSSDACSARSKQASRHAWSAHLVLVHSGRPARNARDARNQANAAAGGETNGAVARHHGSQSTSRLVLPPTSRSATRLATPRVPSVGCYPTRLHRALLSGEVSRASAARASRTNDQVVRYGVRQLAPASPATPGEHPAWRLPWRSARFYRRPGRREQPAGGTALWLLHAGACRARKSADLPVPLDLHPPRWPDHRSRLDHVPSRWRNQGGHRRWRDDVQ
jgi:hypothetical protein